MAGRCRGVSFLSVVICGLLLAPRDLGGAAAAETPPAGELKSRLEGILLKANGTYGISVKNLRSGDSISINGGTKFYMASVFKVHVLVELFRQVEEGKVNLDERVSWPSNERFFGSGILTFVDIGLQPTIRDLATLMIVVSDNTATELICERVGVANVTRRMRELGLSNTSIDAGPKDITLLGRGLRGDKYKDVTNITINQIDYTAIRNEVRANQKRFIDECPNCTTPDDMTLLYERILSGKAAGKESTAQILTTLSRQTSNTRLPRWVPYGVRFEHKTGTVTGPVWNVHDAGIFYLPDGDPVIVSAFARGMRTDLSPREQKFAVSAAEDILAEIGRTVYEFYATSAP